MFRHGFPRAREGRGGVKAREMEGGRREKGDGVRIVSEMKKIEEKTCPSTKNELAKHQPYFQDEK